MAIRGWQLDNSEKAIRGAMGWQLDKSEKAIRGWQLDRLEQAIKKIYVGNELVARTGTCSRQSTEER